MVVQRGSTYRVQLHGGVRLADAAALVPYLARLGITHLYCSPLLEAAPGSTHGYDVVDHDRVSEELGGSDGLEVLREALTAHGLGLMLDVVPNHMAAEGRCNRRWRGVLEEGRTSPWARWFDIDWEPSDPRLRDRVLVPVLGDHYGRVLDARQLVLRRTGGSFAVVYRDHELPVSPAAVAGLLDDAGAQSGIDALVALAQTFPREALSSRLAALCEADPAVEVAVEEAVDRLNADPDRLDAWCREQHYRLARWQIADHEVNYRRFFDVSGLVGIRVDDPAVFDQTHALVVQLVRSGVVDGLRVDHPDGLRDPAGYLERLAGATGRPWTVVEKILAPGEELPRSWPVAGTTGYDFLNLVSGLFVDPSGEEPLTDLYRRFTGDELDGVASAGAARWQVLDSSLATDLERLTDRFVAVCDARRRDFTRSELSQALHAVLAALEVYRTYIRPGAPLRDEDEARLDAALHRARRSRSGLDHEVFELLRQVLTEDTGVEVEVDLTLRFQQLASAVAAKGVEDTALYRYCRFVALNEVGGDPDRFGASPAALHAHNARIAADWPWTLLATSTHDTKRSEDVRARLALLSEAPGPWEAAVGRWTELAARFRTDGMPDRRTEYLLYQTVVGAHPLGAERARAYLLKASREAKLVTSWATPDARYEAALATLVDGLLGDDEFLADLEGFVQPLVEPGRVNSLAQTLVKLTSPGVPDIYRGCEVWDASLVDPDNRRPVDHRRLAELLDDVERVHAAGGPGGILSRSEDGLPKLFVVQRALRLRAERPAAFGPGSSYHPLWATGAAADHLVAFARAAQVLTVVPRLVLGLARAGGWGDTALALPSGVWVDRLGGGRHRGRVPAAHLLARFPVALLAREAGA